MRALTPTHEANVFIKKVKMGCSKSKPVSQTPRRSYERQLVEQEEHERRRVVHDLRNVMNNFSMLFNVMKSELADNPAVLHWCGVGERAVAKLAAVGQRVTGHDFESPMHSTQRLRLKVAKPDQRILIVEDDSVTADLLSHHCETNSIPSHRVKDGVEALRYLLEGTPLWDAVRASGGAPVHSQEDIDTILSRANVLFLDLYMPRVNGLTLLAELDNLGILEHFDVIAMSGRELTDEEVRTLYSYTPNLLVKPLNREKTTILFD